MARPLAPLLACVLALLACRPGDEPGAERPRSLLLVTFDTTRADRLGCYGHAAAATPHADRLAQAGVLFERCLAPTPVTLPSHASLLSGLYPTRHGARNNGTHHVPADVTTLAERLRAEGFRTGAVVSALVLDSRYGLDQGFESYDDNLSGAGDVAVFMIPESPAGRTADRALAWLSQVAGERFFLWVHFFDPHASYVPPEPFASAARDPYDGEIAYADHALGRILDALAARGELEHTLVVFTSDHGESLGEHGEPTHGIFLYDATTRVPLILAHPSLAQGARVEEVVSSVDVTPTVLELLGLEPPADLDGLSLADAVRPARAPIPDRRVYQESMIPYFNHGWSDLRALRERGWRYVRAPRPELYDLERDPAEIEDRLADGARSAGAERRAASMEAELAARLAGGEREAGGLDPAELDADLRDQLAGLGYVWSEPEERGATLADPKDRIATFVRSEAARELVQAGRFAEAEPLLRELLRETPGSVVDLSALGWTLKHLGRTEEALGVLRELTRLPGAGAESTMQLAELERAAGVPGWRARVGAARALDPRNPMPWAQEAMWAFQEGDHAGALELFDRALELDPDHAESWKGRGKSLFHLGRQADAERSLQRALELDPTDSDAHYSLALALERGGRPAEAADAYQAALERDPANARALVNLGTLHLRSRRFQEAEALYRRALEVEPGSYSARLNLAVVCMAGGRREEAAELLEAATAAEPERVDAWRPLLALRQAAGDPAHELLAAEAILRLAPADLDALLAAASAAAELGRPAEAERYLERAGAIDAERVRRAVLEDEALSKLRS